MSFHRKMEAANRLNSIPAVSLTKFGFVKLSWFFRYVRKPIIPDHLRERGSICNSGHLHTCIDDEVSWQPRFEAVLGRTVSVTSSMSVSMWAALMVTPLIKAPERTM